MASSYAALAAQAAWLLALTPFLLAQRGLEEFGAWTIAMSVAGYLRLLDVGLGPTFARFVAADRTGERRSALLSTGLALLSGMGTVAALAGVVLLSSAEDLGLGSGELASAIVVAVLGAAVQVPLRLFSHLLFALERLVERNAFSVLRLSASFAAIVVAVLLGADLVGYLAAGVATEVLVLAVQAVWALRTTPGARICRAAVSANLARELWSFGIATFGLAASTQIVYYSDVLIIGVALGQVEAGVYGVAMRAIEGVSLVLAQLSDAFMPVLARQHAGDREADAVDLAVSAGPLLVVVALPILGVVAALGEPFIALWVGESYDDATLPLVLLAAGLAFNVPLRFPVNWALGAGRHRTIAAVALAEALGNVALSIMLVGPLGINGVALATLVSLAISNGVVIPLLLARDLGRPAWSWYLRPLLTCAAVVAVVALPLHALASELDPAWAILLAPAALVAMAWACAALVARRDLRRAFRVALRA